MTPDPKALIGQLTARQKQFVMGRYDDDFISHDDAATLERLGVWTVVEPDDQDEFSRFEATPLGIALRARLRTDPAS